MVAAAERVAREVLAAAAQITDQAPLVPPANLRALAAAGLFGLHGPLDAGGLEAPPAVARAVTETLAAACGATLFVWIQHHGPVRMLATSQNLALRAAHLPALCAGTEIAGIAFAYLRRPGPPAVRAEPAQDGYRLVGAAPWVTSWGIASQFLVGAPRPDGRLVFGLVPADAPGLGASSLRLAAMQATGTVALAFADTPLPQADVVAELAPQDFFAHDRVASSAPQPFVFGVARAALALLATIKEADGAAGVLGEELERCRAHGYRLVDAAAEGGPGLDLTPLADARAWALDLAARCTHAAVTARGGRALGLDDPAQRLVREATFYAVQAQTRAGRQAGLRRIAGG